MSLGKGVDEELVCERKVVLEGAECDREDECV